MLCRFHLSIWRSASCKSLAACPLNVVLVLGILLLPFSSLAAPHQGVATLLPTKPTDPSQSLPMQRMPSSHLRQTAQHGWDGVKVIDPVVIKDGNLYKMWYSGQDPDNVFRVGYATSTDGIHWTKYAGNPVLDVGEAGVWDSEVVRVNAVIKDGGTYRMWYIGNGHQRIGYATSTDGIHWTKYADNPVFDAGPPGSWDEGAVTFASVILDGEGYKMWHTGMGASGFGGEARIGYATSPDGIHWTRAPQSPVLDVASPAWNVELISRVDGTARAVAVQGNYAYIGDGKRLVILDVSDPADPVVVGETDPLPGVVQDVAVVGHYAYIADDWEGLRIIDVSNPASPIEAGSYTGIGEAEEVAVAGNYAYVAADWSGLRIIDVSDPVNPREAGFYVTPGLARGVTVAGNTAYIADDGRGLRVVDVSDRGNPTEVGSYEEMPGWAYGVAVAGKHAYVAAFGAGLRIIDISDLTNLGEAGFYDTPGRAEAVAVGSGYAYVADGDAGLRIVDISNPVAPREAGYYEMPGYAVRVAVAGDIVYVADWNGGLFILRFTVVSPTPTATPTSTASPTPTATLTPTATVTPTPPGPSYRTYLSIILHNR